jgi:hypothetical protein
MKTLFPILIIALSGSLAKAQRDIQADSLYFVAITGQIDNYVVQKNLAALDTLYAADFVFSHGTGLIEGKEGWLSAVKRNTYPLRKHDSVTVEMHPDLAIVRGKLSIQRLDNNTTTRYNLKYVRLFAIRNKRWQMISHITTHEQHE